MRNVIGISGWSGSGKTTLISNLIKFFTEHNNLKVCALKHAHHSFRLDKPGKDSFRFFEAGANKVIISSSKQWAIVNRVEETEPSLEELLEFSQKNIDIILVEGWKFSEINKIEVYRKIVGKKLISDTEENFMAIATDTKELSLRTKLPILNINDTQQIANFILKYLKINNV
ncbi:molybdopterin-guanine dinucleotide biosynthesis protein B [Alphaproteobacteria bacterium]|nr:molybdopterin-guanine dinucleotide biosynthesis protein B [Alphaproteobacteria bacterium]